MARLSAVCTYGHRIVPITYVIILSKIKTTYIYNYMTYFCFISLKRRLRQLQKTRKWQNLAPCTFMCQFTNLLYYSITGNHSSVTNILHNCTINFLLDCLEVNLFVLYVTCLVQTRREEVVALSVGNYRSVSHVPFRSISPR